MLVNIFGNWINPEHVIGVVDDYYDDGEVLHILSANDHQFEVHKKLCPTTEKLAEAINKAVSECQFNSKFNKWIEET